MEGSAVLWPQFRSGERCRTPKVIDNVPDTKSCVSQALHCMFRSQQVLSQSVTVSNQAGKGADTSGDVLRSAVSKNAPSAAGFIFSYESPLYAV